MPTIIDFPVKAVTAYQPILPVHPNRNVQRFCEARRDMAAAFSTLANSGASRDELTIHISDTLEVLRQLRDLLAPEAEVSNAG